MTTATLGTCNGCGLGLNLPHRAPWHPGQRVVVMTEQELQNLLTPSSQGAKERPGVVRRWCDDCVNFIPSASPGPKYNPCRLGHKMKFIAPEQDHSRDPWGFYRPGCVAYQKQSPSVKSVQSVSRLRLCSPIPPP